MFGVKMSKCLIFKLVSVGTNMSSKYSANCGLEKFDEVMKNVDVGGVVVVIYTDFNGLLESMSNKTERRRSINLRKKSSSLLHTVGDLFAVIVT